MKKKYIISIGRRQPMHLGHAESLKRILNVHDKRLIYIIGSANTYGDPLFNPLKNPLNVQQQITQFKIVFPEVLPIFLPINDSVVTEDWADSIKSALKAMEIEPSDCVIHFIGKPEDQLMSERKFIIEGNAVSLPRGRWEIEVLQYCGFEFWFDNFERLNLEISARNFRNVNLLDKSHMSLIAAPKYLREIALDARRLNIEMCDAVQISEGVWNDILDKYYASDLEDLENTPITLHDLSVYRIVSGFAVLRNRNILKSMKNPHCEEVR